jgi:hypothetical protein
MAPVPAAGAVHVKFKGRPISILCKLLWVTPTVAVGVQLLKRVT